MTTQDIFTGLSYPDGVRKVGNGPDQHDVLKFIAAHYPANTRLSVYPDRIEVISKEDFRAFKKDANRQCRIVDTAEGNWNEIYHF